MTSDGGIDPHKLTTVGRLGGKWYANAAQPYSGDIDELRFYTRAISSGDVTELYNYAGRLPIAPSYLNSLVQ